MDLRAGTRAYFKIPAREPCIIVEVSAATQGTRRSDLQRDPHRPAARALSRPHCNSGTLAPSFTSLEIPLGQAYEFNVYEGRRRNGAVSDSSGGNRVRVAVPTPLRDIAKMARSKNAGPFEIALDVAFKKKWVAA